MTVIKRILLTVFLAVTGLSLSAQEKPDSTAYRFRFVAENDMFFSPWSGNGQELERLLAAIDEHRPAIEAGQMYLLVTSYATDGNEEQTAKEKAEQERIAAEQAAREKAEAERMERERMAAEQVEKERLEAEEQARLQAEETAIATPYHFALRANLLRWATLTPDLGIEWRINRHVGIAVNGTWASWSWDDKNRRYALWEVAPEVRWYLGKEKRGYIGAMYKAGQFNYKLSETGRQGDLMGGGIVGGYQLKLNNALSLDFNLGIGYIHADYDKYVVINGVRVRRGSGTKNWWGPVSAGVTLVWNIF